MIIWKFRERLIANEVMYEVYGFNEDGESEVYGGLFPTEADAKDIVDRLNKCQQGNN